MQTQSHLVANLETVVGTLGGTFLTILVYVQTADVMKTAILAAVGAVVSFVVSVIMRTAIEWAKKNRR